MTKRRRVKQHRIYTVDEPASAVGVAKATVRGWINAGRLPALTQQKPWLIQGGDLNDFLQGARAPRQKCEPAECYCVKCHKPQKPAGALADFIPLTPTSGNLRGICPVCERFMHKRISRAMLASLAEVLDIQIKDEARSISDRA